MSHFLDFEKIDGGTDILKVELVFVGYKNRNSTGGHVFFTKKSYHETRRCCLPAQTDNERSCNFNQEK